MMKVLTALFAALLLLAPFEASAQELDPENTLLMQLASGTVVIRLRPDLAPNHVARAKELARAGFYDGTPFHRVIEGFMAQGGDPTGTGMGGSDLPDLKAEFTDANFGRGTIGAARTPDPDSANSQFFICFEDCSFLNGQYTVWGEVVQGMELVDGIKRGEPVVDPDRIVSMKVAADVN
jgi:peptidylprolyl isomerase